MSEWFDPLAHEYWIDGNLAPGVTGRLARAGLIDSQWFTPESVNRGNAVHRITASRAARMKCDRPTIIPANLMGYIAAYEAFEREHLPVWDQIETPLFSRKLWTCGTPDRIGRLQNGKRSIVDLKTGAPMAWHDAQLGGYLALDGGSVDECELYDLYLGDDGRFRLIRVPSEALAVARFLNIVVEQGGI